MRLFGVYGASGFGRGVMPLVRAAIPENGEAVFVDDGDQAPEINGHRCMDFQTFLAEPAESHVICIAIADSSVRARLAARCAESGVRFYSARSANTVIMDSVEIGEGAILSSFVTLTSNIRIGRHFHANMNSYVAHDCVIGDFVTFAPGVMCNGNVFVDDHAFIGTGAILRQGQPGSPLVIGKGAVVGMGAVVTKSVPPGMAVVGNPARPLVKA